MTELPISSYIKDLIGILNVPISLYNQDLCLLKHFYDFDEKYDPIACDEELLKAVSAEGLNNGKKLYLKSDGLVVFYAVLVSPGKQLVIVGPLIDSKENLTEHVRFNALKHHAQVRAITRCSKISVLSALSLIYKAIYGENINIQDLIGNKKTSASENETRQQVANVLIRSVENTTPHNDSSYELKIRQAVSQGDSKALKAALDTPFVGKRGVIANNQLRSQKNLAIVDITIASRAAIDAGVSPELGYVISDGYILQVEAAKTSQEAEDLYRQCAFEFCSLVKQTKNSFNTDNKTVKTIADFIHQHFYQKLYIKDIAESLSLSSEYIERLFKKHTGLTIGQYLLNVRLNQAKILLNGSDRAIFEIASLTGFNSQSYFVKTFKDKYKITPKAYRSKIEKAH